jgi:hypothetical protein
MKKSWNKGGWRLTVWTTLPEGKQRGDLCKPASYIVLGVFSMIFGCVAGIVMLAAKAPVWLGLLQLLMIPLGIIVLLEWKNRGIVMLSGDRFAYTNTFGRTQTYSFSQITQISRGLGGMKLRIGAQRIDIDFDAMVTERLRKRLTERQEELAGKDRT